MNFYKEIAKNFPGVEKFFTEESLAEFSRALPGQLERYNVGVGTLIRLKLLPAKSALYKASVRNGFADRDKMSMEVLKEFHRQISRE